MQLRKTMWMLTALSAMSLMMTACGGDEEGGSSCTSDSQCSTDEICHPGAGVCVQTCDSGSDCPDSAKTCDVLSASDSRKVCKCTAGTNFCADEFGDDFTCSSLDRVCTQKCASNTDCGTGRTCETATGQCVAGGNPDPGGTCTGTGQSTCAYGQFCSASKCTAVPAPTCANFTPSQGGKQPVWTTSSTGPIIYDVTKVSYANDSFCGGDVTAKARVKAYSTSAIFPDQKSALPGLFYVRINGSELDGDELIRQSEYSPSADKKSVEFTMNFCPGNTSTTLSIGLYFTGGNEICAQLNK
ncbi:hypothetical protein POL68_11140 [Stigmatella sp. ncwal1]|uniref:Lipoprotein n=1 Tax=Stigmatella ashevillensis TaxID=2995309 RepID=A0ABT5D5S5_9BACT|nr:hypothetical protein [Stigmatella ashevillena]MDC0709017.1 hypothetical protein [Stigmatella ashevillena]